MVALAALAGVSSAHKGDGKLQVGVLHRPEGASELRRAKKGDKLSMHYTGTLEDGTVFDSSVERGTPFKFTLGVGQVIKGWDQGIMGAVEGEKRKLWIPSHLAYGERGAGDKIGPGADLTFVVELLEIMDS